MARIRTIKPEFFTSEDIVSMSPLARLLYVALWCEADREGRLVWKPKTFKMRYFPADNCDIDALCKEILDLKLVTLYGTGYAFVPAFHSHQHINPREQASQLPTPEVDASTTRRARVSDVQVGREGKGKEEIPDASGGEEPSGFTDFWKTWPPGDRKQAKGKCLEAWKKARFETVAALVLAHVERMKSSSSWTKNGGEYVPAPLVYLNKRSWEGAECDAPAGERFV
jgi:hypothetical protein